MNWCYTRERSTRKASATCRAFGCVAKRKDGSRWQQRVYPKLPAPAPKRPDPARVIQSYYHQVDAGGKRGAYRRTGDLYNISDESVRRYVLAFEAQANAPAVPDELVYTPPPGGYPMPQPAPVASEAPQDAPQRTPAACGALTSSARSVVAETPQGTNATRQTDQRLSVAHSAAQTPQNETPMPTPEPGPWSDPLPPTIPNSPPEDPEVWPFPAPAPEPVPEGEPVPTARQVVIRERVVMRAPVERPRAGVLQWLVEHEGARQQLIAWAVFLVLVMLTIVGS